MSEPKKTIGVLVIKGKQVLLVRHTEASGNITGIYGLPAGHVESGESEAEAAARELYEETGLQVTVRDLTQLPTTYTGTLQRKTGTNTYVPKTYSWTVFRVKRFEGNLTPSEETTPIWVDVAELRSYELLPNVLNAVNQALEIELS